MSRRILITINDQNSFKVQEGERYHDHLCWDEMLGMICEITHPKIGGPRYPMQSKAEWKAQEQARMRRMAEKKD